MISSNILLDENMSPHLSDFGHVRQKSALSTSGGGQTRIHTSSRYMVTSAAYTEPSLHRDNSKVDPKVDVYSLGVVSHVERDSLVSFRGYISVSTP